MIDTTTLIIDRWAESLQHNDVSPHTRTAYVRAVQQFIAWYEARNHKAFVPRHLTPIDFMVYRQHLQQHQQARSVNVKIAGLRSFCAWLGAQREIATNPAERLKHIALNAPLAPKALKATELHALLRAAPRTRHPQRDCAVVQVLVQTGLRIGECAALRVGDLHLGARRGDVLVRAGKGNKTRTVPLNASARTALATYLGAVWNIEPSVKPVAAHCPTVSAMAPLWRSQKGGAMKNRTFADLIATLVVQGAGKVPAETSAHTLRHTFATNYLNDHPGDLVGLAALLGHRSLDATRIYVQPTQEDLAQRVEETALNAYG